MKETRLQVHVSGVISWFCAGILALASVDSVLAQEWRVEPTLRIGGELDDNALLTSESDGEVELTPVILNASAKFKYNSPLTSFSMQPGIVSRIHSSDTDSIYDSDEYFLRSDLRRQALRNTYGFNVNFAQQSIRRAERADANLEIDDPDDFTDDDSGSVQLIGDRRQWRLRPFWDYQLSDVSTIGAALSYVDTTYDDVLEGVLTNYTDSRLTLDYRRTYSPKTFWGVSLTGRSYDAKNTADETDGYGASAFVGHALSEKTRIQVRGGTERSDISDVRSNSVFVGGVTLTHRLETSSLLAQYVRSANAGGSGTVATRDSLNLNFNRRLNAKVSVGLGIRAYTESRDDPLLADVDRDYAQIRGSVDWRLTRSLTIEVDYRYTTLDRGQASGQSADSNQANLWLSYRPRTLPSL